MTVYAVTTTAVAIHPQGVSPIYGEGITRLELDDEGGGPFLLLRQEDQTLRMDLEELEAIVVAARELIAGAPAGEPDEE